MRVAILTFHRAVNYGAALQAYALYKVTTQRGNDVKIIDYRCKIIEDSVSPFAGFKGGEKNFIKNVKQMIFRSIKNVGFSKFYKKYVKMTNAITERPELETLNEKFDCFIAGSDQIWNWGCSGNDTSFFLDFVTDATKKNSYAASFGFEKKMEEDPFDYHALLNDFNGLSMREQSGADILQESIGKEAFVHVDPTLLLSKDEWMPILSKRPIKQKYIFIYYIREPFELLEYARLLAEKTGCIIINPKKSIEFLKRCSPEDFLAWIYYADYVVTNSFHGTVFSMIFDKKFVVELDNGKSKNNRSEELLNLVGLSDRVLDISKIESINETYDYGKVKQILKDEKDKAIQYIDRITR